MSWGESHRRHGRLSGHVGVEGPPDLLLPSLLPKLLPPCSILSFAIKKRCRSYDLHLFFMELGGIEPPSETSSVKLSSTIVIEILIPLPGSPMTDFRSE